jgi:threonine efflux protein
MLLADFPAVYAVLQSACAVNLIWLGAKMVINVARGRNAAGGSSHVQSTSAWQVVRAGFLTNMANPKSIAYYFSLFVVMIPPDPPLWLFAAAVATALLVSSAWWIAVASFFALAPVRRSYERARRGIDTIFGGVLIALGVRLVPFWK